MSALESHTHQGTPIHGSAPAARSLADETHVNSASLKVAALHSFRNSMIGIGFPARLKVPRRS